MVPPLQVSSVDKGPPRADARGRRRGGRCLRWPARTAGNAVSPSFRKTKVRLSPSPIWAVVRGPRVPFQLLQPGFFHEHDHGPLELRPGFPGTKIRPRSKPRGAIAEHAQGQRPGFDRRPAPLPAIARKKSFAPTLSVSSISCRERRAGLSAWRDRPFGEGRHHGHRLRNGGR
jgi:hypothetical protein